ncbi:hypothetical protein Plhal304r1_c033g0104021 [Plasmopara halstedii]
MYFLTLLKEIVIFYYLAYCLDASNCDRLAFSHPIGAAFGTSSGSVTFSGKTTGTLSLGTGGQKFQGEHTRINDPMASKEERCQKLLARFSPRVDAKTCLCVDPSCAFIQLSMT